MENKTIKKITLIFKGEIKLVFRNCSLFDNEINGSVSSVFNPMSSRPDAKQAFPETVNSQTQLSQLHDD